MSADATELLRTRARALARPLDDDADAGHLVEVVTFELGGGRYALDLGLLQRIVRLEHLAPVPHAPPFVVGVVPLRGMPLPVLDIGRFLAAATGSSPEDRGWLLVLGQGPDALGVPSSSIPVTATVDPAELVATDTDPGDWVRGVTDDGTVWLDGQRILDDPRLVVQGGR